MRDNKFIFVPLCFLIGLTAVKASGDLQTYESPKTLSSSLSKFFQGDVKRNVEKLFSVDWELLRRQDQIAEVGVQLEETEKTLQNKKIIFKKESEAAGGPDPEYIAKLKAAYEKWEKLNQHLKAWTRVKESIPRDRWTDMEKGVEVLLRVQQSISQVETQMREVEAEHKMYASKKEKFEKGEAFEGTLDKMKEITLSVLESRLKRLTNEKEDHFKTLASLTASKEKQLNLTAQSWIYEKNEGSMQGLEKATISISKIHLGKLGGHIDPTKFKEELNEKFNKTIKYLVGHYEETINGMPEEQNNDKIAQIKQAIVRNKIQFNKQQNYLFDSRYYLVNPKVSDNPLQKENALIELINTVVKGDFTGINKAFAEKVMAKAKYLRSYIAISPACRFTDNPNPESNSSPIFLAHLTIRFKGEVMKAIQQPASTPLEKELVSSQVKYVTQKYQRNFQKMVDHYTRLEQCTQTWRNIEDTVRKVDQWKRKMR